MEDSAVDVWDDIRRIIAERLAPTQIVDVEFEEDVDHDGDEIVRIGVVYADNCERPRAEKVVGLTGLVRKSLPDSHNHRFPILTFMTSQERSSDVI